MGEITRDYKIAAAAMTRKVIPENPGVVATTLKSIVASEGAEIYRDIPKLAKQMESEGIRNSAIKQVELVLCGSSLMRYLDQLRSGLSAIDINNIILTAESAGLSSKAARKTVADILYSLNVPQLAQDLSTVQLAEQATTGAIYIPPAAYASRINEFQMKLRNGEELSGEDFSELNAFAQAGVPAAITLLGRIYMEGLGVPTNEETALEKLKYAAAHGDAAAYGLLGDYYYGKDNKKAFELYSRPGALALNETRWGRFRNLQKVKRFHNIQAMLLVALATAVTLFMFLFRISVFTGGHMTACILYSVINCLVVAGIMVVHFRNPYQDLRNYSLPLLIAFFIFAQILI